MYAALLTAIVTWISANFALPPDYNHPQLKLVPAVEITFLRYQAFTPAQRRDVLKSLADNTSGSLAAKVLPCMTIAPGRSSCRKPGPVTGGPIRSGA